MARHNMLRDVLYETAASADLGPTREEKHLLPGTVARPGDITIRRWVNGKDGAIDVTVTGPLCPSNVVGAAASAGASLSKAYERKPWRQLRLAGFKVSSSCPSQWRLLVACTPEQLLK